MTAKILGGLQDEEFQTNNIIYQQAYANYNEQNYQDASVLITEVLKRKPQSEAANYLGGLIAMQNQEFKQGTILLQKTLDLNPHKVEDPMFMLQFAESLYFAERYTDAKVVLEKCREWGWAPESYPAYQEQVTELLTQIENMQ
ncbi:CDC27 family protein [Solibacillus sp. FSL R7-0668]|uniref:tetratricopeptide repeat protein n=1 Tax=Solibacillus sp. FSL R7-0668 TaxID=2921688 RepID=UPI0030FAC681